MACSSCEARRRLLLQRGLAAAKAQVNAQNQPTTPLPISQPKPPTNPDSPLQLPDGTFVYKRK